MFGPKPAGFAHTKSGPASPPVVRRLLRVCHFHYSVNCLQEHVRIVQMRRGWRRIRRAWRERQRRRLQQKTAAASNPEEPQVTSSRTDRHRTRRHRRRHRHRADRARDRSSSGEEAGEQMAPRASPELSEVDMSSLALNYSRFATTI